MHAHAGERRPYQMVVIPRGYLLSAHLRSYYSTLHEIVYCGNTALQHYSVTQNISACRPGLLKLKSLDQIMRQPLTDIPIISEDSEILILPAAVEWSGIHNS